MTTHQDVHSIVRITMRKRYLPNHRTHYIDLCFYDESGKKVLETTTYSDYDLEIQEVTK